MRFPILVFAFSLVFLLLANRIGVAVSMRRPLTQEGREDFGVILAAVLTLLGLVIGFTFSMSLNRFDQRKNFEEAEANAIGTEYLRAGLLPPADAIRVRGLLSSYTDQRILFYQTRDLRRLKQINIDTSHLQTDLWSAIQAPALAQPTPVTALAVWGMNDVLNSQGYTHFAWLNNRIPLGAWLFLGAIAIGCNLMVGYSIRQPGTGKSLILPLFVAISFLFISDIDSPRGGTIHVQPQDLIIVSQSMHGR